MILTDENYYTPEADMEYMSCSQFQGFCECEAKQMAKLQKRWVDEPKEAFVVGNYFHSYFEGKEAHDKFCDDNFNSIFKTKEVTIKKATKDFPAIKETVVTGKYAPFVQADKMIKTVIRDKDMNHFVNMPGENEKIITGEIFGTKWRGKLDKDIPDVNIVIDYKTVANIWETSYSPVTKTRETFVEAYGYLFRAAVYSVLKAQESGMNFDEVFSLLKADELELCDFLLLCVSKQDYPDKEIIRLNHPQTYVRELTAIIDPLGRFQNIKEGLTVPKRCGMCDYCRATKKIKGIKPYYELIPDLRTPREEDDYITIETEEGLRYEPAEKGMVETQI